MSALLLVTLAFASDPQVVDGPPQPTDVRADDALLAALLQLHGREREQAVVALEALGDPRAVPVLEDLVVTLRGGDFVERVELALASFPGGAPVLKRWVLDRDLPRATRIAAARALGAAHTDAAAEALVATTGNRGVAGRVRAAVLDTLATSYPDRVGAAKAVSDAGAVAWTTVGFGTGLGYGVATLGHFGETHLEGLGATAGTVGGATAGWFYARRRPVCVGDASFVTLSEWAGGVGGVLLGAGTAPAGSNPADRAWVGGLIGLGAGAGAGLATARVQRGSGLDAWESGILTGVGVATTSSAYDFVTNGRGRDGDVVAGAATLGGFALASTVAPSVDLRGDDIGFVLLGTGWGAVVGGFVPLPEGQARAGLPVTTGGLAGLASWGLAPVYQRGGDELLGGWVGLGTGTTVGAGVELLANGGRGVGWGPVAGGTGGAVSGVLLANADPGAVDGSDLVWGGLATGWVTWQTLGWLGVVQPENRAGIALTTIGGAGAASAVASRWTRVPYAASLTMGSTALWGTYIGAAAAEISGGDVMEAALVGGDIGLGVGSVALIPRLQLAPVVVGVADIGGVVVGGTSTLIAGLASRDPNALLAASLVGAGVGTAGGALLGLKVGSGHKVAARLPHVDPPGSWGVTPLVSVSGGVPLYGATVVGVGW